MSDAWQVPGPPINRGRRPTPDPCGTVAWKVHCPRPWPMRRRASATTALLVHHDTRWPLARSRHPLNRSGPAGGGGSRRNDVFSRQERLVAGTRDPASPGGHLAAPLAPGDKRRSPGGAGEPGSRGAGYGIPGNAPALEDADKVWPEIDLPVGSNPRAPAFTPGAMAFCCIASSQLALISRQVATFTSLLF